MKEKYTEDQYTDMLGKLKELFEDILSLNDKKEKLKFKYFNEFKSYVDSYIKNNPFAKISDYGLQSPGIEPSRKEYPSQPTKKEFLNYRREPQFKPNIKYYILAFILVFSLLTTIIAKISTDSLMRHVFEIENALDQLQYANSVIPGYFIEMTLFMVVIGLICLYSMLKNNYLGKNSKAIKVIFVIFFISSLNMIFVSFQGMSQMIRYLEPNIEISMFHKPSIIFFIGLPLSLIGPLIFNKLEKSLFFNSYKDIFDYNDIINEKNREIEEFNATYNQRMHNYQSKCKEIDNEYYRQKANYEKSLEDYNTKMSRIEYEVELKNKNIQKIRNEEIAIYKKNYEQILKEEVDKIDLKLSELFAEIGKQLEGKWLPKYYWDLNHISTLLNYFERRNAYTMQEASNHIRNDERTESIIENQNKNMEMIIDSMNKQSRLLENIIKNQNYSNYLQEENLRNVDEIRDRARMVNYQLDFMTENQEQMKSILNSIDINTLKNLTQSKIANYQLGGILGELTYLNIQASAIKNNTSSMNQSLGNINSNVGKIYNRYYGR